MSRPWSTADFGTAVCRSCGAAVVFGITSAGRRMPIDTLPNPAGNVLIVGKADAVYAPLLQVRRKDDPVRDDDVVYASHFQTCPAAREHRR